jgi:Protein of unknown function (DUF3300)
MCGTILDPAHSRDSIVRIHTLTLRAVFTSALVLMGTGLAGCSKADETAKAVNTAAAPAAAAPAAVAAPEAPPPPPTEDAASWTPAALDELLAPIALYPDAVLAQVLSASTNAQEVLDAGNWLLDNQSLQGDALTKAAADADFSPNIQALVHFPTVMDMMCRELDWTKQVGAAFSADQGAVLASVQRLRAQATAAGNLKSSPEMTVEQTKQNDKDVIVINNPNPQVVYVPQYNPTTVYTAPPATTTTTTTTDSGISTSDAVLGGLLAFGAGMAVGSLFDDDDDDYCYPNWGHGGVYYGGRPYYPGNTFVYAPRYGAGYRPTPYYRAPANYANRYNNNYNRNNNINRNTNINVNNNNNYMNRFDKNQNRLSSYNPRSPVASQNARNDYRGQNTYNGADRPRATTANSQLPANAQRPGTSQRPANASQRPATGQNATTGSYQGARTGQANATQRQNAQRQPATAAQRPGAGVDRGYPKTTGTRPDVSAATQNRGGSISGAGRNEGAADRAASERGRSSMKSAPRPSSSARSAGRSGGGRAAGGGGRRS